MKFQTKTMLRNLFVLLLVVVSVLVLSGCTEPQSTKLEVEEKEVFVDEGAEYNLDLIVEPEDAKTEWKSSNEDVAKIEDGKIIAVSPGTATISVKTRNQIFFVRVVVKGDNPAFKEIVLKGGKSDGGDLTISVPEGVVFKLKPAPYKTGHTFSYWSDGEGGPAYDDTKEVLADVVLYPVYKLNDQTISFYVNGELYAEKTTKYGMAPVLPEDPAAPEGHEFAGWRGLLEEIYFDRRVDAIFVPKTYEVKFLVDGRVLSTQEVAYGRNAVAPAVPAKEGFDFIGWDKEYSNVRGALELNAVYRCKEYYQSVKFLADGKLIAEQSVLRGDDAVAPANPEKLGHTFKKWDKAFTNVMEDLVVNAEFEINKYEVKFYKDGELLETQTVEHGAAAVLPANPVKEGHKFVKWDKYLGSVKGDLTVNAEFEKNKYTVKFYVFGEQYGDAIIVEHGEALELTAPEINGYSFVKWDKPVDNITSNLNLNAILEIRYYQVQFLVDGQPYGDPQSVKYGEDAALPATNPSKYGYNFIGWDKEHTNVTDDLDINAEFEAYLLSVKFFVDGVQYGPEQMLSPGESAVTPEAPEKEGHTFIKWDKEYNNIETNLDVNAIFETNNYTVKFYVDGVQYGAELTVAYGAAVPLPEEPTKAGYDFGGWDKDLSSMPAEDLDVNALFNLKKHTVTFYDGAEVLATEQVEHGGTVAIEDPVKVGYSFVGWFKDEGLLEAFDFNVAIEAATNVYAKFDSAIVNISKIKTEEIATGDIVYIKGIVTQLIGNNVYIQDATGGTYLYAGSSTVLAEVQKGHELIVKGKKAIYKGLYQLSSPEIIATVATGQALPAPVEITSLNNIGDYQSQLVSIKNLQVAEKPAPVADSYNVKMQLNGVGIIIRVEKYLPAGELNALAAFFGALQVGDRVNVTLPVGCFNVPQLAIGSINDIAGLTYEEKAAVVEADLGLPADGSIVDADLTLPKTSPHYGATIAYESDKPAIINPDTGQVVASTESTEVVVLTYTITIGSDSSYIKSLTLTVTKGAGSLVAYEAALGAVAEADYTPASWAAYQAVVLANPANATDPQSVIDAATNNIVAAQADLVYTISAARLLPDGAAVTVEGIVSGYNGGDNMFIIDDVSGINVYKAPGSLVAIGDKVRIKGTKGTYQNLVQVTNPETPQILSSGNALPAGLTNITDATEANQGRRIVLGKVRLETISGQNASISKDGHTVVVRIQDANAALTAKLVGLIGQFINIDGNVGQFGSTIQIAIFVEADVSVYEPTDLEKVEATIAVLELPEQTLGNLTLPGTGLYNTTISWGTSNAAVITDAGVITRGAVDQTATLTATVELNGVSQTKAFDVVVLNVNIKSVYTTGFEASEGFAKGTNYKLDNVSFGLDNEWLVYYGTPTTTNAITDVQSIQLRHYHDSTAPSYLIFEGTNYASKIHSVQFNYLFGTANTSINVEFSKDKAVWSLGKAITAPNTAVNEYLVNSPIEDALYVRFIVTSEAPASDHNRFTIDDFVVYGHEKVLTDQEKVDLDLAGLPDFPTLITEATTLTLPSTGANGSSIVWTSDNEAVINSATGVVTLPATDTLVKLTAALTLNAATGNKIYDITVKASGGASNPTWTETFDDMTLSGNSYASGSHVGVNGQEFSYTDARGDVKFDESKALLLRAGSLKATFTNGLSKLEFDYIRAFTGTKARSFEVWINGVQVGEAITVVETSDTPGHYNSGVLNYTGTVELEIKGIGAQKLIDNLSWTENN